MDFGAITSSLAASTAKRYNQDVVQVPILAYAIAVGYNVCTKLALPPPGSYVNTSSPWPFLRFLNCWVMARWC